jgi:hypothetical protein
MSFIADTRCCAQTADTALPVEDRHGRLFHAIYPIWLGEVIDAQEARAGS